LSGDELPYIIPIPILIVALLVFTARKRHPTDDEDSDDDVIGDEPADPKEGTAHDGHRNHPNPQ
jgi:hypothetical protein